MRKYLLFVAALPIVLGSCRHFMGRRVHGNGNIKTEEHSVSGFTKLHVSSTIDVYVSQGDFKPIKIEGDENLLSYIEIEQNGDELVIKNKEHVNLESNGDLKIYVTAPVFRKIEVSGAGNIEGQTKITGSDDLELGMSGAGNIRMEVDVPKLSADVSGVGSMYLKGQTKDVDITISGAGSAHCYDLLAENTNVQLSGVGSAEVYASVKIDAQASGVGSIHYKGNPTNVNQHVSGVGSVEKEQ
ncbi:MAG TPA: head GIN domain-containing protein [Puia sp.]|nr:head GIN domain-containing protein [Puia sp.]